MVKRPECAHEHGPMEGECELPEHEHSHDHGYRRDQRRTLKIVLAITLAMMVVEFVGGYISNSLALMSDAGHMLTHALAISVALIAFYISSQPAPDCRTFGSFRAEVLGALFNGAFLLIVAAFIFWEAIQRLMDPSDVQVRDMLLVAILGLAVNGISVWLIMRVSHDDINIKGAFYHLMGDTLSSVGVVTGAGIIYFTGWNRIDPLIGMMIGGLIVVWAISVLRQSTRILLESVPRDLDLDRLITRLREIDGVFEVHDIHVWSITSGMWNLSAHVVVPDMPVHDTHEIARKIDSVLKEEFRINHCTLQFECKCITR